MLAIPILINIYLPNIIYLGELDGGSNIPIPSIVEVIKVTPTEMSYISNMFGPSYIDVL